MLKTHCKRGHERTPDNLDSKRMCKICNNEIKKQWKLNNPDKVKESISSQYQIHKKKIIERQKLAILNNPEKRKATLLKYYQNNTTKILSSNKKWRDNNNYKMQYYCRKYQATKLQRTPKWLSESQLEEIEAYYILSNTMTKGTGIQHHVDHIIPLQNKKVSGLHVPWNLQVITATENVKKNNFFLTS